MPLAEPSIGDEEIASVVGVLRSGQLAQGAEVAAFESEFAAKIGVRHAVAMNSGTAAIHAALEALEIAPCDDVVTTPFTFVATASPILMQGANVRFADIDARTFTIDSDAIARTLTAETRAVIAVDLFGLPAIVPKAGLSSRGVTVIEDASQAVGASFQGTAAGTLGEIAAFSFSAHGDRRQTGSAG